MEKTQAFLDAHKITQTELGEALGVQGAAISRKLSGSRSWKLGEVQRALAWLSERLGRVVTFDEVFSSSDWSAEPTDEAADDVVAPVPDPAA